nr:hypothetical protein [Woeseiaceae bacterium]
MLAFSKLTLVRLSPLVFITIAAAVWFNDVQDGGPYVARNLLPLLVVVVLAWIALVRGGGRWAGRGWRLPLGTRAIQARTTTTNSGSRLRATYGPPSWTSLNHT